MIFAMGFLLLVSLAASAAFDAFAGWSTSALAGWEALAHGVNFVVSFVLTTALFAMIYRFMPQATIEWRDVGIGALVTAFAVLDRQVPDRPVHRQERAGLGLRRRRLAGGAAGLGLLLGADLPVRRRVHLGLRARVRLAPGRGARGAAPASRAGRGGRCRSAADRAPARAWRLPRIAVMTPSIPAALRRSLRDTFGFDELRSGQHEVISRVLAGRPTLAIMPTGAGKSLCYQLPALHLEGTTVVVSPLISLMKDQAGKLEEAGVAAEQLNSAQKASEQDASMERIADSR